MMTQALPARTEPDRSDAAISTTVNLLAPRERVRGLVAARLFGDAAAAARVGPFELIRELGAGGMGVVYAAHDPRLDRVVALKVLARAAEGPEAGRRLLREAQAMARLKHPNVVPVYEVGTHGDQVFIAMELVDGGTLDRWMAQGPRPWRHVLDILIPAGRGLAAAHAAGLVHRDFKPANVLLDVDGRPRVTDFGLARGGADPGPNAPLEQAEATEELTRALVDTPLTRTGALLGTPAYMSPEHFAGELATARSDIFAFCVVLWEAIYGRRPFTGRTLPELAAAIDAGALTPPPREVRAPSWLRRILARGLATRPADRYASMNELLAALAAGAAHTRPIARIASVAVAAAAVAGGALLLALGGPAAPPPEAARAPTMSWSVDPARFMPFLPHDSESANLCQGDTCTISRREFDAHLSSALAVSAGLRLMPLVQEGAPRGLRLYGLRAPHMLKRLGFRNGDTFVELEGQQLTALAAWDPAVTAASADGQIELTYARNGQTLRRTIKILPAEGPTAPTPP